MAKILVLNDDPDQSAYLKEILEKDGHEVTTVDTATKAITQMTDGFNLVITDIERSADDAELGPHHQERVMEAAKTAGVQVAICSSHTPDIVKQFSLNVLDSILPPNELRAQVNAMLQAAGTLETAKTPEPEALPFANIPATALFEQNEIDKENIVLREKELRRRAGIFIKNLNQKLPPTLTGMGIHLSGGIVFGTDMVRLENWEEGFTPKGLTPIWFTYQHSGSGEIKDTWAIFKLIKLFLQELGYKTGPTEENMESNYFYIPTPALDQNYVTPSPPAENYAIPGTGDHKGNEL